MKFKIVVLFLVLALIFGLGAKLYAVSMEHDRLGNAALAYWQASPDGLSTLIMIQNTNSTEDRYVMYRIRGECSINQLAYGCINLSGADIIPLWIRVSGGNLVVTDAETGADIATLATGVIEEMCGYLELTSWTIYCCAYLAGNNMAVSTALMGTGWVVGINAAMVQNWADDNGDCVVDAAELPTCGWYWSRYYSDVTTHGRLITVFPGQFDVSCQYTISGYSWDDNETEESYNLTIEEVAKTPIGPYEGVSPFIKIPVGATAGAIEIDNITEPMFGFVLMENPSIGNADALPLFK